MTDKALEAPAAGAPKHTPGPWRIRKCGVEIGPDYEYIVCSFDDHLITSASESHGHEKADAKLIASSPKLLKSLADTEALLTALVKDVEAATDGTENALGLDRKARIAKTIADARAALRAAGRLP